MSSCVLCAELINQANSNEYARLTEKGCASINNASVLRNLTTNHISYAPDQTLYVHKSCRSRHTNPNAIKASLKRDSSSISEQRSLRSLLSEFDFKTHCFLCKKLIEADAARKHPDRNYLQFSRVLTLEFQGNILTNCDQRKDTWGMDVQSRIASVHDLPAAEAVYHHICAANFRRGRNIPQEYQQTDTAVKDERAFKKTKLAGRPKCPSKMEAFQHAVNYLEEYDDETVTLKDLYDIMQSRSGLPDEKLYTLSQLKRELEKHYGANVSITTIRQQPNIVTLTSNLKHIVQKAHEQTTKGSQSDINEMIKIVGEFIRAQIKNNEKHNDIYPSVEDIESKEKNREYLPPSLRLLLQTIIKSRHSELQTASIGQAIMQSTCPRSFLAPLQLGLSVMLEHKYGHRDLVDLINKFGFCLSYSESLKYRKCAASTQGVDISQDLNDTFMQYMADNIDHATNTLDGSGTVHVMGQMASFTPSIVTRRTIPRKEVSIEELKSIYRVSIIYQKDPKGAQSKIVYTKLGKFYIDHSNEILDTLWSVSVHLKNRMPMWSGSMQMLHSTKSHPGKSSAIFLPLIDLTPSDPTCVRSTLEYVSEHARRHKTTPVLTFDQQLWWIAYMIIKLQPEDSPLHKIVLILGGFHTEMSFLGTIGSLMSGTGLREAIAQVYADGSVDQMLSGKAVSRAMRAHILVDRALNTIVTSEMCNTTLPTLTQDTDSPANDQKADASESEVCDATLSLPEIGKNPDDSLGECEVVELPVDNVDPQTSNNEASGGYLPSRPKTILEKASSLVDEVTQGIKELQDVLESEVLKQLYDSKIQWCEKMKSYRTAKLWLMYMEMVKILRSFLTSSRSGNWKLYIQSLHQMLPYLAASGHNNYTKSLVLYLTEMENLESSHPSIYTRFKEGLFVLRRTDTFWSGLFSDLYIEQVLMGSIKSVGGLTRGRGFDKSSSLVWLLSAPACGEVHKAMQEITSSSNNTTEELHKDRRPARVERDQKDLLSILNFLIERKPFQTDKKELRSLSSGIVAEKSVNVDSAVQVGEKVLHSMEGKSVLEFRFSKKDQVKTLLSSMYVSIDGEKIELNPQQLYQRLLVAGIGTIDIPSLFMFELCSYPTSLFDQKLLMRQADKAELQNGLVKKASVCTTSEMPSDVKYVVDGGALLQKLPWPKSVSYGDLVTLYIQYMNRQYKSSLVVFDGYENGPSTKDEAINRTDIVSLKPCRVQSYCLRLLCMYLSTLLFQRFLYLVLSEINVSDYV